MSTVAFYLNLFLYDEWATTETINSISKLKETNPRTEALISHIIAAQEMWLARILGEEITITPWHLFPFEECSERAAKISSRWSNFLEGMSEDKIEERICYQNTHGDKFKNSIKDILTHVINHTTYHRAQIALLVREAGGIPAVTDYIVYARTIKSNDLPGQPG